MVADDAILLIPTFEKPGIVTIRHRNVSRDMPIAEAERYKDDFERGKLLPRLKGKNIPKHCRRLGCAVKPKFRCKACRASYCSRRCQRIDWYCHIFVCTISGRPTLTDYFFLIMRGAGKPQASKDRMVRLRRQILDDADISNAFGFHVCETLQDVNNLICIFGHLTSQNRNANSLQKWVDDGNIQTEIRNIILAMGSDSHRCHRWFLDLDRRFDDRKSYNLHAYIDYGFRAAISLLPPEGHDGNLELKPSERKILWLYALLLKEFDYLPEKSQSQWIDFGFCLCQTEDWKFKMADSYLELATKASLTEMATAFEVDDRLDGLFEAKGLDISEFQRVGITFGRPRKMEFGIYRLMKEIDRIHRGVYCKCAFSFGCCHRFPESLLSSESVVDYGFDQLNPWERWHMMVLYRDLFSLQNFDPREMLAARRATGSESLQDYIERMLDTRKYWNKYKAGLLFPDVRGHIDWIKSTVPTCYCICH